MNSASNTVSLLRSSAAGAFFRPRPTMGGMGRKGPRAGRVHGGDGSTFPVRAGRVRGGDESTFPVIHGGDESPFPGDYGNGLSKLLDAAQRYQSTNTPSSSSKPCSSCLSPKLNRTLSREDHAFEGRLALHAYEMAHHFLSDVLSGPSSGVGRHEEGDDEEPVHKMDPQSPDPSLPWVVSRSDRCERFGSNRGVDMRSPHSLHCSSCSCAPSSTCGHGGWRLTRASRVAWRCLHRKSLLASASTRTPNGTRAASYGRQSIRSRG